MTLHYPSHVTSISPPFLGNLSCIPFNTEYRSLKEDPAKSFYRPCLLNSILYKRAVGYFRSSIYLVIGTSIVEFVRRGGKIRLICSPDLSPEDIDGIAAGYSKRSDLIQKSIIEEIETLLAEEETSYPTQVLATLVALGALDIKLAVRSDRKGMYHEKIGVFIDGMGEKVSFKGSSNETWSAWHSHGNFESIEVFCSWRGGLEAQRVERHENHFDTLWSGSDQDVEVFSFPIAAVERLKMAAIKDGLEAIDTVSIESSLMKRELLPHQSAALEEWERRKKRGIFEHATGSGKTFTAIAAIRKHVQDGSPAIVLVPSKLLLEQWASELRNEIPSSSLLLAGGGHNKWKDANRLKGMTSNDVTLGGRVVLSTMQTAASEFFISNIIHGEHLLVVADEVHQVGSPQNSKFLEVGAGSRLGLSATPTRYGDPEGTQKIFDYFGDIVPPAITLLDAIHAGRLVEYEYYPHPVNFTASEADSWREISKLISLEVARSKADDKGNKKINERAKMLLIKRSRIAKKAEKKILLAKDIIKREYREGQHWLVYCEDKDQLRLVMEALKQEGFTTVEYHSNMRGARDATLSWFKTFGGPLVSIRCLDEGVDIPVISHALVLASSQNPRQFIQRRGRVLRKTHEKQLAVIHDAIVVPVSLNDEPEQTALLKSEMLRSIEFAKHAINKMAGANLRAIAVDLGWDPDSMLNVGVEEEEEDDEG